MGYRLMIAGYEHPKGKPHAKEIGAEELHQLAFRANKRALSVGANDGIKLAVVVPISQVERFHGLIEPANRDKVVVVPREGCKAP